MILLPRQHRCCQTLPDAPRCSQMLPDAPRCSQMLPDAPRCSQTGISIIIPRRRLNHQTRGIMMITFLAWAAGAAKLPSLQSCRAAGLQACKAAGLQRLPRLQRLQGCKGCRGCRAAGLQGRRAAGLIWMDVSAYGRIGWIWAYMTHMGAYGRTCMHMG